MDKDWLKAQSEVDDEGRARTVDWMVGLQLRLRFSDDTLYQAIGILDRFLALYPVQPKLLPLLGLVGVLVAGKCEEVCPPRLKKLLSLAEGNFTRSEAINLELQVMKCLGFDIVMPTVLQYLLKLSQSCLHGYNLALYICESQTLFSEMSQYPPSLIAMSGFYLASKAVKDNLEVADLPLKEFRHSEDEVKECAQKMISNMISRDRLESSNVGRKYSRFRNVIIVAFNSTNQP